MSNLCSLTPYLITSLHQKVPRIPLPPVVFLQLIRLCGDSNSTSLEGRFYAQTFNIAIGSSFFSLSSLTCSIGVLSSRLSFYLPISLRPSIWLRYVDDVTACQPYLRPCSLPGLPGEAEDPLSPSIHILDTLIHRSTDFFFLLFIVQKKRNMHVLTFHQVNYTPRFYSLRL